MGCVAVTARSLCLSYLWYLCVWAETRVRCRRVGPVSLCLSREHFVYKPRSRSASGRPSQGHAVQSRTHQVLTQRRGRSDLGELKGKGSPAGQHAARVEMCDVSAAAAGPRSLPCLDRDRRQHTFDTTRRDMTCHCLIGSRESYTPPAHAPATAMFSNIARCSHTTNAATPAA